MGCTFYVIAQQLRTRRCVRCTFYLFSGTEPIIETSTHLRVAPLALAYAGLELQLKQADLDPARNFWNAIFDFSSPDDSHKNWRLADVGECSQYLVTFTNGDISGNDLSAFPTVTEAALHAPPLSSGQHAGHRVD